MYSTWNITIEGMKRPSADLHRCAGTWSDVMTFCEKTWPPFSPITFPCAASCPSSHDLLWEDMTTFQSNLIHFPLRSLLPLQSWPSVRRNDHLSVQSLSPAQPPATPVMSFCEKKWPPFSPIWFIFPCAASCHSSHDLLWEVMTTFQSNLIHFPLHSLLPLQSWPSVRRNDHLSVQSDSLSPAQPPATPARLITIINLKCISI